MFDKEIAEMMLTNPNHEARRKAFRLRIVTIITNPYRTNDEKLDSIERTFKLAGWKEPEGE